MPTLAESIFGSANRLGIDPIDLGTAISYETGGTFDPWKKGPTTQWGEHRGLIQWGEPQRRDYGVYQGMPDDEQMRAVERYLINAGVKPGMGLDDVYSAINAGRVGRGNATDAHNGGAPGTVSDKVRYQMAGHQSNAKRLLSDLLQAQTVPVVDDVAFSHETNPTVSGGFGVPFEQKPPIDGNGALSETFLRFAPVTRMRPGIPNQARSPFIDAAIGGGIGYAQERAYQEALEEQRRALFLRSLWALS